MPILFLNRYDRSMIRKDQTRFYVFGDNAERKGFGGQAAEARNEPNAIGIPTKWKPSNSVDSFFTDDDVVDWMRLSLPNWTEVKSRLDGGAVVVWPADGIGTGLAGLSKHAPTILAIIEVVLAGFVKQYGEIAEN